MSDIQEPALSEKLRLEYEKHRNGNGKSSRNGKPVVYVDLDGVCADYHSHFHREAMKGREFPDIFSDIGVFRNLPEIPGAVESVNRLFGDFDVYFASSPVWETPEVWMEKRLWVGDKWGESAARRLILTHNKGLLSGDYLIDDTLSNGVPEFGGEHIWFATDQFPNWDSVMGYLLKK